MPFTSTLSDNDRRKIFREMVKVRTRKDRVGLAAKLAEQYGVTERTIYNIRNDDKLIAEWLAEGNRAFDIAMGQVQRMALDALAVQAGYIHNEEIPIEQQYLRQNAAVDVMNRANLRHKDKEDNTFKVVFEGATIPVGMPPTEGKQDE